MMHDLPPNVTLLVIYVIINHMAYHEPLRLVHLPPTSHHHISRSDPDFILAAAAKVKNPENHLHYADVSKVFHYVLPESLFEEVGFMRKAVGIMASAVHFAAGAARDDVELWRIAIANDTWLIRFAPPPVKAAITGVPLEQVLAEAATEAAEAKEAARKLHHQWHHHTHHHHHHRHHEEVSEVTLKQSSVKQWKEPGTGDHHQDQGQEKGKGKGDGGGNREDTLGGDDGSNPKGGAVAEKDSVPAAGATDEFFSAFG